MLKRLGSYIANIFREGTRESFGRIMALPFLLSSWGIGTASGITALIRHESAFDDVAELATIGIALFTGSKLLSFRGKAGSMAQGGEAPAAEPKPAGDAG
jgi:hypothetical protein